jgi:hypothetical protein
LQQLKDISKLASFCSKVAAKSTRTTTSDGSSILPQLCFVSFLLPLTLFFCSGEFALIMATSEGHFGVVDTLLQGGAAVNAIVAGPDTPDNGKR